LTIIKSNAKRLRCGQNSARIWPKIYSIFIFIWYIKVTFTGRHSRSFAIQLQNAECIDSHRSPIDRFLFAIHRPFFTKGIFMRVTPEKAVPEGSAAVLEQRQAGVAGSIDRTSTWFLLQRSLRRHWQLYLLMIPTLVYFIVFRYVPMANAVIAFKDYNVVLGIWGSPWAGFRHFDLFFSNPVFWTLLKNTLGLSLYSLVVGFPLPILLALGLNEIKDGLYKRTVQMVTYAPYFISTVIMVSMIIQLLAPRLGIVNIALQQLGMPPINFLGRPDMFPSIYVWSGVWQFSGYAAIIYLAALSGVDPQLYEAAKMDGASRLQKIYHIDLPGIMPVAIIILILNVGTLLSVGFEKIFLLQNPLNLSTSEVIATYVYKVGLLNANFSFATAVGLFNSIINMILLVLVNAFAKRISNMSLW
jgi:putative aldouronate transport system permease protein